MPECFNRNLKPRIKLCRTWPSYWIVVTSHYRIRWNELTMQEKENIVAARHFVYNRNMQGF